MKSENVNIRTKS